MRRFTEAISRMLQGFYRATERFPVTVFWLLNSTALACYMIWLQRSPSLLIQKLMFVFLLGAVVGVTAQFACERFPRMARQRMGVYALALLLTFGYYLLIAGAPAIDYEVGTRTTVAIFSMFCAFIWLPSYGNKSDFNSVALIHFKSAFTSLLYASVLAMGLAALIAAVDILLFDLSRELYGYMLAIVWLSFAPIHYLARLPRFNSEVAADRIEAAEASEYPRILEILISQIAIPLVAAYTLVLLVYLLKIGLTGDWPIGQLGPMILGYSAAGLMIYVLASPLGNRAAVLYQRLFPKLLIPVVSMQLFSVYIRLRAYGVTESRYYLTLFGVFSLVVGVVLSSRPVTRNGIIAVLAAALAIISILPPTDAFAVSRMSQVTRLEGMLQTAGILVDGQLQPQTDVDLGVRREATNILSYLTRRNYLRQVEWLPADFTMHRDMAGAFGFGPTYPYMVEQVNYFSVSLDPQAPVPIAGYDVLQDEISTFRRQGAITYEITAQGRPYRLVVTPESAHEVRVSVQDAAGQELVGTGLEQFVTSLRTDGHQKREMLGVEQMTLDVTANQYKLRIIFKSIQSTWGNTLNEGTEYRLVVLIGVPAGR